jgi:hypothetical protein
MAAAGTLLGCTAKIAGEPLPAITPARTSNAPSIPDTGVTALPTDNTDPGKVSDSPGGTDASTAELQPCDLLTSAEQSQLQITAANERVTDVQRLCEFNEAGDFGLIVGIADERGIGDVQSATPTQSLTIGAHDAVQATDGANGCAIILGVTDTSRVDIASAADTGAKACNIAKQVAGLVEPKLP